MGAPSGVLVVDKPRGPTSHDVVARVRRALRTKAVGHAGTLDPMATGVLVVAVGEATKLVLYLTAADKAYEATIALGVATATLDADGDVTARAPVPDDWPARLDAALAAERARDAQVPPAFSAIQTNGVRAYDLARRGEAVDLAPRPVRVVDLTALAARRDPPAVDLAITTAKGYYVRALARDLAAALGTVGHLTALRRTRSGAFTVAEAAPLDDGLAARLVPLPDAARRALPIARLTPAGVIDARAGRPVAAADLAVEGAAALVAPSEHGAEEEGARPYAWLDEAGDVVAVGAVASDGRGRVLRGFVPGA